jgi:23S rRNA (cytidine1920-2'-O)/16S rRNA (cytidine1409-2'-O)-methyltransferase
MRAPTTRGKERIDLVMVDRGLVESRHKARAVILAGSVLVNGIRVDKAGATIDPDADIVLVDRPSPFVSRGGQKLAAALDQFGIDVAGLTLLDVGASTGGFTDCLLKAGASRVYALDVGYGQLAWELRGDGRVVTLERTNIRHAKKADFPHDIDGVVIDVSFISLRLVLPVVRDITGPSGFVIALIKPQFEVGRHDVGKGGVVRDPAKHERVVGDIADFARSIGFSVTGTIESPLLGPKGNKEFLIYLRKE